MGVEEGKALVRRFFEEVVSGGRLDLLGKYVAEDAIDDEGLGIQGARRSIQAVRDAFPDLELHVVDSLQDGDKVAARFAGGGTHLGTYLGQQATGRKLRFWGLVLFRVSGGKFVELWRLTDITGLLRQLREKSSA